MNVDENKKFENLENINDSNSENENMEFKPLEQVMQSKLMAFA